MNTMPLSGPELLAGALDAGDFATAAACILANPGSTALPRETVARFFKIAVGEIEPELMDVRKIESAAKVIGGVQ